MPLCRLIWGFAGYTYHIVGNLMPWLKLTLCIRARKALGTLSICTGWPEPLLHKYVLSTKITCACSSVGYGHSDQTAPTCNQNNKIAICTPIYSKTCVKQPLSKWQKIGFQDQLSLNAGQKYCRMLQGEILQYFRPLLSYHLTLRSLFCLFLNGSFTPVLL